MEKHSNSITKSTLSFMDGIKGGLPIGLGYLSVSFSFGVYAVSLGLSWWQAVLVSIANLTSAGQVAGVGIMSVSGGLIEMIVSQIVINVRYSLMSISLSQKADSTVNRFARLLLAYGITDEIFGVAIDSGKSFGRKFFLGLMVLPILGWTLGTLLGAILGSIFPEFIVNSLSIGIYGMFVAIVLPVAKKNRNIAIISGIAVLISVILYYVKIFSFIPGSFMPIISAIIAAGLGAILLPVKEDEANA